MLPLLLVAHGREGTGEEALARVMGWPCAGQVLLLRREVMDRLPCPSPRSSVMHPTCTFRAWSISVEDRAGA